MDVQILCAAVQEAPAYLSRFTRKEYPLAFREYAERFAPVWTAAVRETAGEETALTVLADNFLEGLEQGWRRQRFWNRSSVRVNEKQMVVGFLTPLLLGLEEPLCPEFAQILPGPLGRPLAQGPLPDRRLCRHQQRLPLRHHGHPHAAAQGRAAGPVRKKSKKFEKTV